LRGINQNNRTLPDGPVIMSPDRLMASLHRYISPLLARLPFKNVF
jgi:phosphatidate phosphatase LPIN